MKAVFYLFILTTLNSKANVVGNDTQNFTPNTSGLDFITVQSSETLAPGYMNIGLFFNDSKNSLPDVQNEFDQIIESKDHMLYGDLGIGYGISENVDIGISFSSVLNQKTDRTTSGAQFSQTGLDEIRINSKYNFFRRPDYGMALVGSFNFNQVRNNPFIGRGAGPTTNLEFVADTIIHSFKLALNLGYRWRARGKQIDNAYYQPLTDQYIGSLGVSYYFHHYDTKLVTELYTAQQVKKLSIYKDQESGAELLIGLKFDHDSRSSWNIGIGMPVVSGLFVPDQRVYAGINYSWDALKKPPPKNETVVINETTVSHIGFQPEDLVKLKDKSFDDIQKEHEFTLRTTMDISAKDKNKAPFEVIRMEGFDFDFGSSVIRPEYNPMFEKLASYLNAKPDVIKVQVEGHTDSIGSPERNRFRSQQRADAVKNLLIQKGAVPNVEIAARGFGPDRPVADNGNYQGRRKNRRVEIRILRMFNTVVVKEDKKITK